MTARREEILAACDAAHARGVSVTAQSIRMVLRMNMNIVSPVVRAWKDRRREEQMAALSESQPDAIAPALRLQQAVEGLHRAVAQLAPAISIAVLDAAAEERADDRLTIDTLCAEMSSLSDEVARLNTALEVSHAEQNRLQDGLQAQAFDLDREVKAKERLEDQADVLNAQINTLASEAAASRASADAALADAERAREQLKEQTARLGSVDAQLAQARTELAVSVRGEQAETARAARAEAEVDRILIEKSAAETGLRAEIERLQIELRSNQEATAKAA